MGPGRRSSVQSGRVGIRCKLALYPGLNQIRDWRLEVIAMPGPDGLYSRLSD